MVGATATELYVGFDSTAGVQVFGRPIRRPARARTSSGKGLLGGTAPATCAGIGGRASIGDRPSIFDGKAIPSPPPPRSGSPSRPSSALGWWWLPKERMTATIWDRRDKSSSARRGRDGRAPRAHRRDGCRAARSSSAASTSMCGRRQELPDISGSISCAGCGRIAPRAKRCQTGYPRSILPSRRSPRARPTT